MPDKKTELMVFTTDIKTKIDKLKEYIKNYDQNKVATVDASSISPADASAGRVAVSASPVATVVNK
jgi:adenine/guanine phosphoribosyltransferase-like PRPP-binding protein